MQQSLSGVPLLYDLRARPVALQRDRNTLYVCTMVAGGARGTAYRVCETPNRLRGAAASGSWGGPEFGAASKRAARKRITFN